MEPIQLLLPTIFEGMTVNSWLILEPEPTLIDCGEKTDQLWDALVSQLAQHGLTIKDLKKVILTHGHLDHMGMAKKITEHSDATIWMNEYLYDWAVDLKKMLDRRSSAIKQVMDAHYTAEYSQKEGLSFGYDELSPYWEEIPAERIQTFSVDQTLNFGGDDWEVIYAPGHCINQTCFFNPKNGYFFSADMLLRMIPSPIIDADLQPPYGPQKSLVMQMETYKKVAQLKITKTFPGHFSSFDNAHELIEKQVGRIHLKKEKCFSLIQNGVSKALDLANEIYPNRINHATLFMVIGFLDILQEENRIESELVDGLLHFYAPKLVL